MKELANIRTSVLKTLKVTPIFTFSEVLSTKVHDFNSSFVLKMGLKNVQNFSPAETKTTSSERPKNPQSQMSNQMPFFGVFEKV